MDAKDFEIRQRPTRKVKRVNDVKSNKREYKKQIIRNSNGCQRLEAGKDALYLRGPGLCECRTN